MKIIFHKLTKFQNMKKLFIAPQNENNILDLKISQNAKISQLLNLIQLLGLKLKNWSTSKLKKSPY